MTIEQFEKMSPKWIKSTIGIDLVSSSWETFAGPRFKDASRNGRVLEYSCGSLVVPPEPLDYRPQLGGHEGLHGIPQDAPFLA